MTKLERIMQKHPEIQSWLENRPLNTQKIFASRLMQFCRAAQMAPEKWRRMDKFEARDLAWQYIKPMVGDRSSVAVVTMAALKSWFRNLNGEKLPFDSGRGGKHNIRYVQKKAAIEHIPNKREVYEIVDMASSLRDKAILLVLFQTGLRVNALCSLKYGDVKDQLENDIIMLRITWDIDQKLRGTQIPFYVTCLNGEGARTLRQYCKLMHEGDVGMPLFFTKSKKQLSQRWVWKIVKNAVRKAGFDPQTISTHTFRKAFRKIIRRADIDDDDKEQFMGHVISGSREAYFDRHDIELIREAYSRCDFSREVPESEVTKLRKQLEDEQGKRMLDEMRLDKLEKELESTRKLLQEILTQKEN